MANINKFLQNQAIFNRLHWYQLNITLLLFPILFIILQNNVRARNRIFVLPYSFENSTLWQSFCCKLVRIKFMRLATQSSEKLALLKISFFCCSTMKILQILAFCKHMWPPHQILGKSLIKICFLFNFNEQSHCCEQTFSIYSLHTYSPTMGYAM